ncbi:hypothetical protein BC830DRAFT_667959 [Chytriomyces sp. MP71]|nr:hypothetical protein BC830DRAFT_667959 [Chytriomyces sp. MP71]
MSRVKKKEVKFREGEKKRERDSERKGKRRRVCEEMEVHQQQLQLQQAPRQPVVSVSAASVADSDFELETYLSQYTGHTRILRLEFISEACPSLAREALTLALAEVKAATLNTTKHNAIVLRLNADLGASVKHDQVWVEDAARLARSRLDKLDAELKNYKSNLIKESIRVRMSYFIWLSFSF